MTLIALLKNWRVILGAAGVVLVVAGWAYLTHLRHVAQAQKAQLEQASRQAVVQTATTKAVDQLATKTIQVTEHTHEVVRTIQASPGADSPIPPAVRDLWLGGLSDDPDAPR